MDYSKLEIIKNWVLEQPLEKKQFRDGPFCGVLLHSNSPFKLSDYEAPVHAFRAFSAFEWPIYFFISEDAITPDFEVLVKKFDPIKVVKIPRLTSAFEFNNFCINQLLFLIDPKHQHIIVQQFDGFLLRAGYEEVVKDRRWVGAAWKEPVNVVNTLGFKAVQFGNGGCGYRHLRTCLQILELVNSMGGQEKIVKGIRIHKENEPDTVSYGPYLAEDLFFSFFGQNFGLIPVPPDSFLDDVAAEPLTIERFYSNNKPYFFHRID